MQRFSAKSTFQNIPISLLRRCISSTSQTAMAASDEFLGRLPPFEYIPPPYTGPSADVILNQRKEFLSSYTSCLYKKPLNIVDGKMQYLFDESGRRYLDAFAGIAVVNCGHCHPHVVKPVIDQIKRLQHPTTLYLNHAIADFSEALASKLPGDLKVVFFTNSGTEANELALMMAKLYTGYQDIVSIRNGYHGNAAGTMGATGQSMWKFNVVQTGTHHALNPDPYRGVFGSDGEKYARELHDLIQYGTTGHIAGFVFEAIQGVGGIVELAPGYLSAAYDIVKKAGGLFIADEVQSVVTTPEIARVLTRRCYFNTFGGNAVATTAGLAVLNVIEKDKLQENASMVGSYLKGRLDQLKEKHEIIGDVRGRGLMLGVELVSDRKLKTPATAETLHIMDQMKELGVLVGKGGFFGNVFRITPPLCFTKDDADYLVEAMDYSVSKM
ncbi:hypothetical protein HID58_017396 [Brassica napus]|uniref:Uncharacterized protein n=1 Tax=Brassica napus TaxID=3708 RepID=A0ABQ8D6Z2_BRANA|nr:hypothetical protein HID58_017396 [Brassica napus]